MYGNYKRKEKNTNVEKFMERIIIDDVKGLKIKHLLDCFVVLPALTF